MAHRIEVVSRVEDARAKVIKKKIGALGLPREVTDVKVVDVYTVDSALSDEDLRKVAGMFVNPVSERADVAGRDAGDLGEFDSAVEIGYQPGVTNNVGTTAREEVEDYLGSRLEGQGVYSSSLLLLSGLSSEDLAVVSGALSNPLIQRARVLTKEQVLATRRDGSDIYVPRVNIREKPKVDLVNILNATDEELAVIGKQGIANADGTRRGPLAMDLAYMKALQNYFRGAGRDPTDVEVESVAQTWSEHCKHTIFADAIDEIKEGLYKTYIREATRKIREAKGERDFCVSVFTDNAGAIVFDENFLVTDKVETHNSPSALDPFGGSITGIVGVNRDAIGFGLGAKPIINRYGFCFGNPDEPVDRGIIDPDEAARNKIDAVAGRYPTKEQGGCVGYGIDKMLGRRKEGSGALYKDKGRKHKMLSPRRIMDGVIEGVNVGGNCSGIPTTQGFAYFDDSYRGKPLVFVGTLGLIPRVSAGRDSCTKEAKSGDYIVMAGGRVGKDGIHGATFSSEAIDSGSPVGAVQIGDPITQKKMSDAIVKEARDLGLYTSITDDGAGGLSCSVAEMAKESGGCRVDLDKVPLKYPGLNPWEIWVSESQERMTLSVPKDKWDAFSSLMQRRGVEATVIGEFDNSGRCVVDYNGKRVVDIDMNFLHDGLPARPIITKKPERVEKVEFIPEDSLYQTRNLHQMLARRNVASKEFISTQYDHEVQGGSVIKPLQGRGRVDGDATIVRPVLNSHKGVVLSHGLNPSYSELNPYQMAACAIDTAIRNAVAVGADPDKIAILDNFCWCSSTEPERLWQLKEAARALHDYCIAYGTPPISGKDSMFNDFKGFDEEGKPIKISILPTLLVSSIGIMGDTRKAVSLDAKFPGDVVYVLGSTNGGEVGGSEYLAMLGEQERGEKFIGERVPYVDARQNLERYRNLSNAIQYGMVSSAIGVGRGGLGVALARTAMGGRLGMNVNLSGLVSESSLLRKDYLLFSESQGRFVVTVNPEKARDFEQIMEREVHEVGEVSVDGIFTISCGESGAFVNDYVDSLLKSYKSTFKGY